MGVVGKWRDREAQEKKKKQKRRDARVEMMKNPVDGVVVGLEKEGKRSWLRRRRIFPILLVRQ